LQTGEKHTTGRKKKKRKQKIQILQKQRLKKHAKVRSIPLVERQKRTKIREA
jgi:hypothetical protein